MRAPYNEGIVKWVFDEYGFLDVEQWIKTLGEDLIKKTNQLAPPIMLQKILKLRNIEKIYYPENYISIKKQLRFTIAHEIAHTYFYDLSCSPPQKKTSHAVVSGQEALCNRIASEILMPESLVIEYLKKVFPEYQKGFDINLFSRIVKEIMDSFDVSQQVVTRCLIERLEIWDAIVLGVRWLSKPDKCEQLTRAKLIPGDKGFIINTEYGTEGKASKKSELMWRLCWCALPKLIKKEIFIPYRGNPRIYLEAPEDLYQNRAKSNVICKEESSKNFRIGNCSLRKALRDLIGPRLTYKLYGYYWSAGKNKSNYLFSKESQIDFDWKNRTESRITVCIPLSKTEYNY